MNAIVLNIKKRLSKYGGFFYYVHCKTDEGISCKTCVSPSNGNYSKWQDLISKMPSINAKEIQATLIGVKAINKTLLDADVLNTVSYREIRE